MSRTNISWCDEVWNPIVGCSKMSLGCRFCYAQRMAYRLKKMGRPEYQDVVDDEGHWTGVVRVVKSRLEQPIHWCKPRKVFVCSMSDLFHPNVPVWAIHQIFGVMGMCKSMSFYVLTKRPKRMNSVLFGEEGRYFLGGGDYHPNIRLMVSVENQRWADERIPDLLRDWRGPNGVSVEPMLSEVWLERYLSPDYESIQREAEWEPVSMNDWRHNALDWVICGAESGPNRRPFDVAWAEGLYEQCEAAGVPFFGKQASGARPGVPLLIRGKEVKEWPQ